MRGKFKDIGQQRMFQKLIEQDAKEIIWLAPPCPDFSHALACEYLESWVRGLEGKSILILFKTLYQCSKFSDRCSEFVSGITIHNKETLLCDSYKLFFRPWTSNLKPILEPLDYIFFVIDEGDDYEQFFFKFVVPLLQMRNITLVLYCKRTRGNQKDKEIITTIGHKFEKEIN